MSKYIEKVEQYKRKILEPALNKLKEEYSIAEDFYRDTGYDKYFKKMNKCEKEINEIEEYISVEEQEPIDITTEQYKDYERLKQIMQMVKSNIEYIMVDLPECHEKERLRDLFRELNDYKN